MPQLSKLPALLRHSSPLLCLALASAACSKSDNAPLPNKPADSKSADKASAAPENITVYSGRSEKLIGPVIEAFNKSSSTQVLVKYAGTAELAATLLEEGDNSPADVFIAQDASTLTFLEGNGTLAKLPTDVIAKVAVEFRSPTGAWVGTSGRARVLAYATKLDPATLPKSVDELTGSEWKGRVGWAPPNASFQSFVGAMNHLRGGPKTVEWLKAMKANAPKDYPKNTPAVLAISRGEIDVALVNHYYLYRLKAEHGNDFPVANHYFKNGQAESMVNLAGAGIVSTSKKKDAAAKFIAYLVSPEGQAHFVKTNYEFPVTAGVVTPKDLPSISDLNAPKLDLAKMPDLKLIVQDLQKTRVLK